LAPGLHPRDRGRADGFVSPSRDVAGKVSRRPAQAVLQSGDLLLRPRRLLRSDTSSAASTWPDGSS
jgi:hypothetical protein